MNNSDESSNDPILYELLEYFVRKQEPEVIKCKHDTAILPSTGTIKNALRYLNNRYSLPESISQQVSLTLPWKFALADNGRLLTIVQETVIEIRKAKDEYSSIVGRASVLKDNFPQWRKILWSSDGTILVLASSCGQLSFYNALGNNIFNISPKTLPSNTDILEAGDAVASMLFLKPRFKGVSWPYEFIFVTYSGLMKSYYVSAVNGFKENYEFSFGNFYKNGINAVTYDSKNDLLYVAGNTITHKLSSTAIQTGLTSWRFLNDYPFCKLSFTFDHNNKDQTRFSIWNLTSLFTSHPESIIFKIQISHDNEHLISLHTDGSVSLWRLPNLALEKKWKLSEQPDYNIPNPLAQTKNKKFPHSMIEYHPVDVGWWSNQAIIIARFSGSVSVCSLANLKNLLGTSPEFLAGQPQISELGLGSGFLCLDCETIITSRKRSRESIGENHSLETLSESEKEDDELEPETILSYTTHLMQNVLYYITDIERFQPKRKKTKILHRMYRILGLKSTTPEELYSRKIDIEEYEEALALAKAYNLDTDLVYQTQWRKSELSLTAIKEHLSKVSKRSWVLNECVTRVPDTIEAARELLNFGLRGANIETLIAIGEYDNGKFTAEVNDDLVEEGDSFPGTYNQVQKVKEAFEKLNVQNLSNAQKELINYRRKLLDHLDKLLTYELTLPLSGIYNKETYQEFRQLSVIDNAVRFAKNGDYKSVEIMFTYFSKQLSPYWLSIISFFPETLNPKNYEKLLPECDTDGQLFLLYQCELRLEDWSEKSEFDNIIDTNDDDSTQISHESNSIYKYSELTHDILQNWYKSRAYEIERNSFMTDNALQLIKIGRSHNIKGLENLLFDLETLDDIVYKVHIEDIFLDSFEKMIDLEKIKLLMSKTNEKSFIDDIKQYLLPFIRRKYQYLGGEMKKHLLSDYLITLSKDNLNLTTIFFDYMKQSQDTDILEMIDDMINLGVNCIYACHDLDMYQKSKIILDSLSRDYISKEDTVQKDKLIELEHELTCVNILRSYSVRTTLNNIHKNKTDSESAKLLLIQMARNLNKIVATPTEEEWAKLLNEMLEIHHLIFECVDIEICFEICVSARLVSGQKINIQNCAALVETKKEEKSLLKVSYETAVKLILDASKEYFNSSRSLIDSNMELAKTCLHLITDNNEEIKEEYDLINSLQILHEFNIDILPLQVRLSKDRLNLIQKCLDNREDAYKSRQRLITLAHYLRVESKNPKIREGKVLELITKKAFQAKDYMICRTICQELIQNNYILAWSVIMDLGYCNDFRDLEFRKKCLWFGINNGPDNILQDALNYVNLIEIQILNNELQLYSPSTNIKDTEDNLDSDDEFTDALTTPQTEIKEFVPNVLETSSEIVRNSAHIVKQSTFDLIRNVSNANFWKKKLNILQNLTPNVANELSINKNVKEQDRKLDLQSFPCFYESLHTSCNLSTIYTQYDTYSLPEIEDTQLKYCHVLLRIALLSQSSCSQIRISDIDSLLLECAKHILPEDWLLGITYLLHLHEDFELKSQDIFIEFAQNELYAQTALYYFSLKLYMDINPDANNLYLYNPIRIIQKVIHKLDNFENNRFQEYVLFWYNILCDNTNREESKLKNLVNDDKYNKNDLHSVRNYENINDSILKESQNIEYGQTLESGNFNRNSFETQDFDKTVEWTDDWGQFSDDENEDNNVINSLQLSAAEISPISENDRFIIFKDMFEKLDDIEQYQILKRNLIQWPKFTDSKLTTIDEHPVLTLIRVVPRFFNSEKNSFGEYNDLVLKLDSSHVLKEFLETISDLSNEDRLCICLCTDDLELHEKAVDLIKKNDKTLKLSKDILENIYLKDLTAYFNSNYNVYKCVIEQIFIKRTLPDIERNANTLIRKLMEQKRILDAVFIFNQIKQIPESFNTFECILELVSRN